MSERVDWVDLVRRLSRDEFVRANPYYFLVGKRQLVAVAKPRSTGVFGQLKVKKNDTGDAALAPVVMRADDTEPLGMVRALKQAKGLTPGAPITVGRTENNDVVLPDTLISRTHAILRVFDDRVELTDEGSANGTFLGGQPLPANQPRIVQLGDQLRFSHLEFELLDAATCWDRLRQAK